MNTACTSSTQGYSLRINLGADSSTKLPDGTLWLADRMLSPADAETHPLPPEPGHWQTLAAGRVTREPDLPLHPPSAAELLRTEVHGLASIRLRLPPGAYRLRLWVGETFENLQVLDRRYHLSVNGQPLAEPVHPFGIAGGFARAGILEIEPVRVGEDGSLVLAFDGSAFGSSPIASALEILPLSEAAPDAPPTVRRIALAPHEPPALPVQPKTGRLDLFVAGHSGMFHWALPETLRRMLAWSHPHLDVRIDIFQAGGKDVRFFAESPEVTAALEKPYDFFIAMDSSWGPLDHPGVFEVWMPRLAAKIRESGAVPLLYAYSGPQRHSVAQRSELMRRYVEAGTAGNAIALPCADACFLRRRCR